MCISVNWSHDGCTCMQIAKWISADIHTRTHNWFKLYSNSYSDLEVTLCILLPCSYLTPYSPPKSMTAVSECLYTSCSCCCDTRGPFASKRKPERMHPQAVMLWPIVKMLVTDPVLYWEPEPQRSTIGDSQRTPRIVTIFAGLGQRGQSVWFSIV